MNKTLLCVIIVLTLTVGGLSAYADDSYIGHWALTLPTGGPGWLGITQEKGNLEAAILWGGGSVKPVTSAQVEGDRLVITRVQVERRGADKGRKITETITATLSDYKIFEMNIDGTGLQQVSQTPDDVDCFEPCYLPDGRIIVNSNAPYQSVPCWHGTEQNFVANLYLMEADGSNMRRLTFDQDHDFHPSVRNDGQVVYSCWDYTGINWMATPPKPKRVP